MLRLSYIYSRAQKPATACRLLFVVCRLLIADYCRYSVSPGRPVRRSRIARSGPARWDPGLFRAVRSAAIRPREAATSLRRRCVPPDGVRTASLQLPNGLQAVRAAVRPAARWTREQGCSPLPPAGNEATIALPTTLAASMRFRRFGCRFVLRSATEGERCYNSASLFYCQEGQETVFYWIMESARGGSKAHLRPMPE